MCSPLVIFGESNVQKVLKLAYHTYWLTPVNRRNYVSRGKEIMAIVVYSIEQARLVLRELEKGNREYSISHNNGEITILVTK